MVVVERLRRAFGPILAVNDVSFAAEKGEVLGILGPNGAGKSTAMKMLTCFLPPDAGTASICGHDVRRTPIQARRSLGYVAENAPLYSEMTVAGFLKFICDVRRIGPKRRREAIDNVVETCSLGPVYHQTIETLSKGYQRRVALGQALIHDPPVLILDEPTDGLDPNQKHEVRKLIRTMSRDKCILISTHILEEVEAVCSRVIILDGGAVRADATPQKLKDDHGGDLTQVFRKITAGHTS
ncbi:MAG: ATP-binding cassette domain-containing protein [Phycisphaerae bacterium]|nr:ATP-binding cassette domain-containing protein [Phycisphaerae bacterium]